MFHDPQSVPDNYLLHLVANSKLLTLQPGAVLMREGDLAGPLRHP